MIPNSIQIDIFKPECHQPVNLANPTRPKIQMGPWVRRKPSCTPTMRWFMPLFASCIHSYHHYTGVRLLIIETDHQGPIQQMVMSTVTWIAAMEPTE